MRRPYPERISNRVFPDDTGLNDYRSWVLSVDESGNVLEGPNLFNDRGDHFVIVRNSHDLDCVFKNLPLDLLRQLAYHRRVRVAEREVIERPRPGRDDFASYSSGTRRKTCFYGVPYLLGKKDVSLADIDDFVTDLRRFIDARPIVGSVAKRLMYQCINNNDLVRCESIPIKVLELFNTYGRGGNMDSSVLGTIGLEVKVDQRMSYLSIMAQLKSPSPNIFRGKPWLNNGRYDPEDAYGIYCIDGWVDKTLSDTPVYKEVEGTYIPIVGHFNGAVVLKPTMDDLKWLEKNGLAKVARVHWSWRTLGRDKYPYRILARVMHRIKEEAVASNHFFKLVACAVWGLTLQKYVEYDKDNKPHLIGGYWFNPVIGYTTTDLMRSVNFRAKIKAEGKVSAEVVDTLIGPEGDWYDDEVFKVKGPSIYTHIGPLYHVSSEDDRLGLLEELKRCRKGSLERIVQTRLSFGIMKYRPRRQQVKDAFGSLFETKVTISVNTSKRKFPDAVRRIKMADLMQEHYEGVPMTEEEAQNSDPQIDWNAMLFELATGTLLEKLIEGGKTW